MVKHIFRRISSAIKRSFTSRFDYEWAISRLNLKQKDLERPYSQHAWIYACIRSIATRCSSVEFKLYKGKESSARIVEDGALYNIFQRPNPWWSHYHLWEATTTHLMLDGNALWVLDRSSERQPPREIWVFGRERFEPEFVKDSAVVRRWKFKRASGDYIYLEPFQVIWFFLFNPYSSFWGVGPLESARLSAEQDWLAQQFNRSFFENSADPGGILTVANATPDQINAIERQFRDKYAGARRAFRTLFLSGDAKYQQLELKHTDMSFVEQRKMSREEICAVFHVPPSEVGIFEKVHKATAEAVQRAYWEGTIIPILRLYESAIYSQFFIRYDGGNTWGAFDLSSVTVLHDSYDSKLERAERLFRMGIPFSVINEHLQLGLPKIKGDDVGYLPMNLMPTNTIAEGSKKNLEKLLNDGDSKVIVVTLPNFVAENCGGQGVLSQKQGETEQGAVKPSSAKGKAAVLLPATIPTDRRDLLDLVDALPVKDSLTPWSPLHVEYMKAFEQEMKPVVDQFNRRLRSYLQSVGAFLKIKFKEEIEKAGGKVEHIPINALDLPIDFDKDLMKLAHRHFERVVIKIAPLVEAHMNRLHIPFVYDPVDKVFLDFLAKKELKIKENVNDQGIRRRVREELERAKQEQLTVPELEENLKKHVRLSRARAATIARTETSQTANGIEYQAYVQAGVKKHQWVAAIDERTRETHVENMSAGPWPIGQPFPSGLLYPGDMNGPPEEVINCRCRLIAIE